MTFANILPAPFGKRPVWLYKITRGARQWLLTSKSSDFVEPNPDLFARPDFFGQPDFFNDTWQTTAITHSRFKVTSSTKRAETKIVLPGSHPMNAFFMQDSNFVSNELTIFQEFENDPDQERVIKFRGRVIAAQPTISRMVLVAENRFTELRRKGLSVVIQRPCRHSLYQGRGGVGCGVDINAFQIERTATAITGKTITINNAGNNPDGYFNGGILTYKGKRQMIVEHVGITLRMMGKVSGLAEDIAATPGGVSIQLAAGCDLTRATCATRFNNIENFGGFPWADESPFDGRTLF